AIWLDRINARDRTRLTEIESHPGKDHDGKKKIGNRTRRHDRRAPPDALVVEAAGAFFLGHLVERFGRRRRGLAVVAKKLDIAAERDGRDLPSRSVPVVEAGKFGPKANRKG